MAKPVTTECATPESLNSILAASSPSFGFPMISPSHTTTVSAPMKNRPSTLPATSMAFPRASRSTWSSGSSPGRASSGILPANTSNSTPADANSSTRRGEAEARIILAFSRSILVLPFPCFFLVNPLELFLLLPVLLPVLFPDEVESYGAADDHHPPEQLGHLPREEPRNEGNNSHQEEEHLDREKSAQHRYLLFCLVLVHAFPS